MKIYLVGGAVRDLLLDKEPHDRDYVVIGSTVEEMLGLGYKQVGKDFPVFLHPQTGEEYALARKEVKTGDKHTDFSFEFGPNITLEEDLIRRDLTCNSIAQDVETGEYVDPFNGIKDIKNGVLRHTSEHFVEDPLRVLRVARFSSQLPTFAIHDTTLELCRQMVDNGMLQHLTPERVWKEMEKALKTEYFDLFLLNLKKMNALQVILPEVYALTEVPENEIYHPEGNAWLHTLLTLQQVKKVSYFIDPCMLNFALMCHDLGKAKTNKEKWPAHHGHDDLGLPLIDQLCDRLKVPNNYKHFARLFCKYHMKFYEYLNQNVKTHYDMLKDISLFRKLGKVRLDQIINAHYCDLTGRKGVIGEDRLFRFKRVKNTIEKEYFILEDKTLEDLPKETQENLSKFKGEKFGKLYRDAMISYLKNGLYRKLYKNRKNGKIYEVLNTIKNCTNEQDGQEMYLYKLPDQDLLFVRSIDEFLVKFEVL